MHMHIAETGKKRISTCIEAEKGTAVVPDEVDRPLIAADFSYLVKNKHPQASKAATLYLNRALIIPGAERHCQSAKYTEKRQAEECLWAYFSKGKYWVFPASPAYCRSPAGTDGGEIETEMSV